MWSAEYRQFVTKHRLAGREVEIPEGDDLSGLGASFEIYDEVGATSEANDFYPGLVVKADGYVPIGACLEGSGDPYFINVRERQPGPLYRIYHDAVVDENYDRDDAIVKVLESYEVLLRYVEAEPSTKADSH